MKQEKDNKIFQKNGKEVEKKIKRYRSNNTWERTVVVERGGSGLQQKGLATHDN